MFVSLYSCTSSSQIPQEEVEETPSVEKTPYIDAETDPGTGNIIGQVVWNNQGVASNEVLLCGELTTFARSFECRGEEFRAKTNTQGEFSFVNVPVGEYGIATRIFESDSWLTRIETVGTIKIGPPQTFSVKESSSLQLKPINLTKPIQVQSPSPRSTVVQKQPMFAWEELDSASYYSLSVASTDSLEDTYEISYNFTIAANMQKSQHIPEQELLECIYKWNVDGWNEQGERIATSGVQTFEIANCQNKIE
ncbi:MAG: hypothetical protein F6J87_04055 [Spirulina sp. SIO3F2]|nr:hypothetical protein [Spirulina sp. SIO3F2]